MTVAKQNDNGGGGKARGGLGQELEPSSELAEVIGSGTVTRAQANKRIWEYIKKNDLQDPEDRRMIVADDKLRPVFNGKDRVSMFEMAKLLSDHLHV